MVPTNLTIVNGAMAMDGGSIFLEAIDQTGNPVHLNLHWSIAAQQSHSGQLSANGVAVSKGSEEEQQWLDRIRAATIHYGEDSAVQEADRISQRRAVLGKDIQDYFTAIDEGPSEALRSLVNRLVSIVLSEAYRSQPSA